MTWDDLFSLLNLAALGAWAVLILAPRSWTALGLLPRLVVPGAVVVAYSALLLAFAASSGGGFGSIAQVRALFASDPVLVAGWGHYLAFDLLVGVMLADRMDAAGVSRLLQAPILVAVFMAGPLGWLIGTVTAAAAARLPSRAAQRKEA